MGKCAYCGKEEMTFRCPICKKEYCAEHTVPELHYCSLSHQKDDNLKNIAPPSAMMPEPQQISSHKLERGNSSKKILVILFILLVIGVVASYFIGDNQGYQSGYKSGDSVGYSRGISVGYDEGYKIGYDGGYSNGTNYGYNNGFVQGKSVGYTNGYNEGENTGYSSGYSVGNTAGYTKGYSDGVKVTGYNTRYPTYDEMMTFIRNDQTDKMTYNDDTFNCHDFAATVIKNAFKLGYQLDYVYIQFPTAAHSIVAFNTTDRGLIYVEPQYDKIVTLIIGKSYASLNGFISTVDETIKRIDIIP